MQQGYISDIVQVHRAASPGSLETLNALSAEQSFLSHIRSVYISTAVIWICLRSRGTFRAHYERTRGWRDRVFVMSRLCSVKNVWCTVWQRRHPQSSIHQSHWAASWRKRLGRGSTENISKVLTLINLRKTDPWKIKWKRNYAGQSAGLWNMDCSSAIKCIKTWLSRRWCLAPLSKGQLPALQ